MEILKLIKYLRLDKCGFVEYYKSDQFEGYFLIIMELLGNNLYQILKINNNKGFPLNVVRYICKQIVDSLFHLHKNKMIHSDLKVL